MSKSEELVPVRVEARRGFSRYKNLNVYVTDDQTNEFYEGYVPREWGFGPGDGMHTVSSGEVGLRGLTLIANRYYQRPDLWWIIAEANGITLPTKDMKVGMTLHIPSSSRVFAFAI
jgi:hypothetical protein